MQPKGFSRYMLLRSCLGFMMAMVRAGGQRDSSGKRKNIGTCLEMVITNIFEGHCFVCRLAQVPPSTYRYPSPSLSSAVYRNHSRDLVTLQRDLVSEATADGV